MERGRKKPAGAPGRRPGGAAAAAATAAAAVNPFEVRGNKRLRFDILGRRVTGGKRDVAAARTDAHARRSAELLPELRNAGKRNTFQDRRFGEGVPGLDEETKSLVRFQKERMRQLGASKRARKFQLDEGGGDGGAAATLTHGGRSLDELGVLSGPRGREFEDEEEEEGGGVLDAGAHFGGMGEEEEGGGGGGGGAWRGRVAPPAWATGEDAQAAAAAALAQDPSRRRSYKEIMEEVMAKSKAARAQRAEDSQEHAALLESLDAKLDSVTALLRKQGRASAAAGAAAAVASALALTAGGSARGNDRASRATTVAEQMRQGEGGGASASASASAAPAAYQHDDFDSLVHALSRAKRTHGASDRTKTPEELAAEEASRLKELEELRVARMRGGSGVAGGGGEAAGKKRRRGRGGGGRRSRRRARALPPPGPPPAQPPAQPGCSLGTTWGRW